MPLPEIPRDYSNVDFTAVEARMRHYDVVYKLTSKVLNAINRCNLEGQYWMSTKDDSNTVVIHTEDYYFEGPIGYVADLLSIAKNSVEFINSVENSMVRKEYPWMELMEKDGGEKNA